MEKTTEKKDYVPFLTRFFRARAGDVEVKKRVRLRKKQ